jgi:general secretion pathway protein I
VRGFTLLEVMVALAIMAGVVLTVISSVNYHLSVATRDREETVALLLARAKIEDLGLSGTKETAQQSEGTFAPDWPEYSWKVEVSPAPVTGVKRLTVTVNWGAERRTLSLENYLVQKK